MRHAILLLVLFAGGTARGATIHLTYALYAHGLHVMRLDATLAFDGSHYTVDVADHTVGLAGALINTHTVSSAAGTLDASGVHPTSYRSAGHSRGADRRTVIEDAGPTPTVAVLTPVEARRDQVPPADTVGTVDPLSALAGLVDRVAQTGQCDAQLRIFDGARLTLVVVRSAGHAAVPASDRSPYAGTALRCDFTSRETAGFLHDDDFARAHETQTGTAWVARLAPGQPPVPIRADFTTVEHGPVQAYLQSAS